MADTGPARGAVAVTPHDSDPIPRGGCRALFIGGAGDLVARGRDDTADVTFVGLAAGTILPFEAKYVRLTGTTATNIVALY